MPGKPNREHREQCDRKASAQDVELSESGLDRDEQILLTIMRYYFQSFAMPQSQGWMQAIRVGYEAFPEKEAANLTMAVLAVVQTMRSSRQSGFQFSNPDCAHCARTLSGDERQLMGTVASTRRGQRSRAHTHALLLCEGNDTEQFLNAVTDLTQQVARAIRKRNSRLKAGTPK